MLRTDVIYRVIDSPTQFDYSYSTDGVSVHRFETAKRARQACGDLPIVPIDRDGFNRLMTPTIHAHFETIASDCDGQIDRSYVVPAFPGEDELDFHERIVSLVVDTYAIMHAATLRVRKLETDETELEWTEPTEEGHRYTRAVICTRDCDTDETTYRDHRAEEMGY